MNYLNDEHRSAKAKRCLAAIAYVLKLHGFALGHEDSHGAFIIRERKSWDNDADVLAASEEING